MRNTTARRRLAFIEMCNVEPKLKYLFRDTIELLSDRSLTDDEKYKLYAHWVRPFIKELVGFWAGKEELTSTQAYDLAMECFNKVLYFWQQFHSVKVGSIPDEDAPANEFVQQITGK